MIRSVIVRSIVPCIQRIQFRQNLIHTTCQKPSKVEKFVEIRQQINNIPQKVKTGKSNLNLVWIDCEMTGLDPQNDHILEIAVIITDKDLNVLAEGPNLVIHQSDEVLSGMGVWCVQTHGESGLTEKVKNSTLTLEECEKQVLEFVQEWTKKGKNCLAGNSIGQDAKFLEKHMPNLMDHLHYRIVDVSTVKELVKRWYPGDFSRKPSKKLAHRALDDILESIDELRYWREVVFKEPKPKEEEK